MAQYFEVLSQNDGSLEQTQPRQFFNGNQENERTQIRYILADDSPQFQTQQLILSGDQVMVLDSSQQQIQRVVIEQGRTYQATNQQQQFGAVVQNTSINDQPTQQIFFMDTNSQPGENVQAVQTVIEQNSQTTGQPQPVVLNHQLTPSNQNVTNRQVLQGNPTQRPVLQIRTPLRQGHIQVSQQQQQPRPLGSPMRSLPQQARPHQSTPIPLRSMAPQLRIRNTTPPMRQPVQQQQQQSTPRAAGVNQLQQAKSQLASLNRQMNQLQQKQPQQHPLPQQIQQTGATVQQQQPQSQQVVPQQPQVLQQSHQQTQLTQQTQVVPQQQASSHVMAASITKGLNDFHRQQLKNRQERENNPVWNPAISIGKQIIKPLSEFRPLFAKDDDVDELDDHDPTMNSSPGQLLNYKKLLEQRQQMGKNPILARLPSNIKVTPTASTNQQQLQSQTYSSLAETIDQVVNQVSQQPQATAGIPQQPPSSSNNLQLPQKPAAQKKPRAPPRSKNPNGPTPRQPGGAARQRAQRMPAQPPVNSPRLPSPQQPALNARFPLNQPQPRYTNQQQQQQQYPHQQRAQLLQQQPNVPAQPPPSVPQPQQSQHAARVQQQPSINNQSQMNYLITPPTPNRPRQQHPLPAYIPSSQIQQIIGMFQENTPIAEEFSDSIRMLVLLENGEQRLITFTLPKEACTIQEILEQVNVPFTRETNIQVTEANTNGINYIVTVGNVSNFGYSNNEEEQQSELIDSQQQQQTTPLQSDAQMLPNNDRSSLSQKQPPISQTNQNVPSVQPDLPKPASPEVPKLVAGKLAVCDYCGYTGEDFNKCRRCARKLPDNVKSIDAPIKPVDLLKSASSDFKQFPSTNSTAALLASSSTKPNDNSRASSPTGSNLSAKADAATKPPSPTKKKVSKSKPLENESVVISSDEEDDEKKSVKSVSEQLLNKLGASISISPVTKEPSLTEIKKHVRKLSIEPPKCIKIPLKCRTVRIGSYRFVPGDDVILESKCVIIKAPVVDNKSEIKTIRIDRGDIVKVLVCFNKALPVIFYYLNVGAAPIIREMLNLNKESGLYFDPVDEKEDSFRKITLLPDDIAEEFKTYFQQLYGLAPFNIMDELTGKEANDILIKACPKDSSAAGVGSFSEIKQILMYPKEGQGRLSINTEDYVCLAVDQFLNDKIIDFYLKYLWENLPPELQEKVHIFSTFFYKRLTTKATKATKKSHPFEADPDLTAAEKRHLRVRNWTKKINLFEKDFIIVPINENAHWFLAIICFPWMRGPQTFDGKPYNPEPKPSKAKSKPNHEVKKEKPIPCDDPLLSDKDEAESEESDMESDDSEEAAAAAAAAATAAAVAAAAAAAPTPKPKNAPKPPIKQPCILIFDSLAGPSRSRVVATLRDYLTVEFKVKMDSERVFTKDEIKGASCKVPQQNNFTDCGLYLLQYVEQFFKDPIKDYNIPIKGIGNWFEEITVTKKREDICNLLKELMIESGADIKILPDIALPTVNGKLVERQETDRELGEEEQEDMFTDIEDSEMTDASSLNVSRISEENGAGRSEDGQESMSGGENSSSGSFHTSPIKPSDSSVGESSEIVTTVMQPAVLKPTLSEFPRQTTNKDTLNYLKAKRIIRHKTPSEGPDFKKTKLDI